MQSFHTPGDETDARSNATQHTVLKSDSLRDRLIPPWSIQPITQSHPIVGGYGDVQQAVLTEHPHLRDVAVKMLRPHGDWCQRVRVAAVSDPISDSASLTANRPKALCRELRVLADLRHPNILALQGFYLDVKEFTRAEIITLWQENGNISKYIAASGPGMVGRIKLVGTFFSI